MNPFKNLSADKKLDLALKIVGVLLVGTLAWFNSHYVPRSEFAQLAKDMGEIRVALSRLTHSEETNRRQDAQIQDLDIRSRVNEGRINKLEGASIR